MQPFVTEDVEKAQQERARKEEQPPRRGLAGAFAEGEDLYEPEDADGYFGDYDDEDELEMSPEAAAAHANRVAGDDGDGGGGGGEADPHEQNVQVAAALLGMSAAQARATEPSVLAGYVNQARMRLMSAGPMGGPMGPGGGYPPAGPPTHGQRGGAAPEPPEPSYKFKHIGSKDADLPEELMEDITGMRDHYEKRLSEYDGMFQQLETRLINADLDAAMAGIDAELFGSGSRELLEPWGPQMVARLNLQQSVNQLAGMIPNWRQTHGIAGLVKQAYATAHGERVRVRKNRDLRDNTKRRAGQVLTRPTHRPGGTRMRPETAVQRISKRLDAYDRARGVKL